LTISRDPECLDASGFGLPLDEGKAVLSGLQAELTQLQVNQTSALDRPCLGCCSLRGIHDYSHRSVHSLFGVCRIRRPRFRVVSPEFGAPDRRSAPKLATPGQSLSGLRQPSITLQAATLNGGSNGSIASDKTVCVDSLTTECGMNHMI
jgi:hypothetical protein